MKHHLFQAQVRLHVFFLHKKRSFQAVANPRLQLHQSHKQEAAVAVSQNHSRRPNHLLCQSSHVVPVRRHRTMLPTFSTLGIILVSTFNSRFSPNSGRLNIRVSNNKPHQLLLLDSVHQFTTMPLQLINSPWRCLWTEVCMCRCHILLMAITYSSTTLSITATVEKDVHALAVQPIRTTPP